MKKLILLTLVSTLFSGYFSDNFLKYSTLYGSVSLESPFTPKETFKVNQGNNTFEF